MTQMQLDWSGGTNAAGLGRWHKCSWVGMVAQIQLESAGETNAAGLGWWYKWS